MNRGSGTGGIVKGLLLFCGLVLLVGLLAIVLPQLDDRERDYEERLVGSLNAVEDAIAASLDLQPELYDPSIQSRSRPGYWSLSDIMVAHDGLKNTGLKNTIRAPFSAAVESTCPTYLDVSCWRVETLVVAGRAVGTTVEVGMDESGTISAGANADSSDVFESGESATSAESAASVESAAIVTPVQGETIPQSNEPTAVQTPETPSEGDDTEGLVDASDDSEGVSEEQLVRLIQETLKQLEYDPGPVDGKLGSRTASKIKSYQRDFNLPVDGIPLRQLHRHMKNQLRIRNQQGG